MTRLLLASVALVSLSPAARGGEAVVRFNVRPMAASKPALKYLLLPEVRELNPGNPVQWYIRSFQEQRIFYFSKEANAERARYRTLPLAKLPAGALLRYGGSALRAADWAARLDTPDWEVLQRVQGEGPGLRLTELGPLRIMGEALQVRFRGAVAGRRFDDAVHSAKTMFALARHLGKCPVGAANGVGLTTAGLALDTLEEMVQQPGCPNLYWALTDLPGPLVDLRKGIQGDRVVAEADLRRLRQEPMTDAEVEAVVGRLSGTLGYARERAGRAPRSLRAALRALLKDPQKVQAARLRLLEAAAAEPRSPAEALRAVALVPLLPPAQVILLDEKRAYEEQRDERLKLLALTPGQIDRLGGKESAAGGLFADLLPDVARVRRTQARVEQRVALLRHVEALRLYAAAHDGRPPAQLSDCAVPLPADPFTGQPFRYETNGATAHLRGGGVHYEVTIK